MVLKVNTNYGEVRCILNLNDLSVYHIAVWRPNEDKISFSILNTGQNDIHHGKIYVSIHSNDPKRNISLGKESDCTEFSVDDVIAELEMMDISSVYSVVNKF